MADIELVVKIPEEMYAEIMDENGIETMLIPYSSIVRNGTQLPKGHGDLIDRRELKKDVYTTTEWNGDVHRIIYEASVDDAPTIIEAGKAESEEK